MEEDTSLSSRSSSPQLVFINDFSEEEEEEEEDVDSEGEKEVKQDKQDRKRLDISDSKQDMVKRSSSEEGSVKFTNSVATDLPGFGYPKDALSESSQFVVPVIKQGVPVFDNTTIAQDPVLGLQSDNNTRLNSLANPSNLIVNPPLDNASLHSQSNPSTALLDQSFQQFARVPVEQSQLTKGENSGSTDHTRAFSQSFDSSTSRPPDLAAMKLFSRSWDSRLLTEVQQSNLSNTEVTGSPAAASSVVINRSNSDTLNRLQTYRNPPSFQPAEQAELPMSNFSSAQFSSGQLSSDQNFKKPENSRPRKQPNKNSRTSPRQQDSPPRNQGDDGVLPEMHQDRGSNSRLSGLEGDNSRSMLFQEHDNSLQAKGSNFAYTNASPGTQGGDNFHNSESVLFQKDRTPAKTVGSLSKYPDVVPDVAKGGNYEEPMSVWGEDMVSETKELFPQYQSSPGRKRKAVPPLYGYKRGSGGGGRKACYMIQSPMTMLASYAKEIGSDLVYMLENAEDLGMNLPFPCLQCYEKYERTAPSEGSLYGAGLDLFGDTGTPSKDARCKKCGGQLLTLVSYGKMIMKMRKTMKERHLVAHDVYPDGNCLFATVADQLRIQGNFRFTVDGLRQVSVEYLRRNPHAEDGTHFELFLSGETWDQYLERMAKDGVWGDHMVLSALANVLDKRIVIFGGFSGQLRTVISPKLADFPADGLEDSTQSSDGLERTPPEAIADGKDVKDDENKDKAGTDKTHSGMQDQGKKVGGELARDGEEKTKESNKEKETGDEDIPVDDIDMDTEGSIFLGHLGESHYISLRRENWKEKLEELLRMDIERVNEQKAKKSTKDAKGTSESESDRLATDSIIDPVSRLPVLHINFLLRQLQQTDYITTTCPPQIQNGFFPTVVSQNMAQLQIVGDPYDNLHPAVTPMESYMPDIEVFFPSPSEHKDSDQSVKLGTYIFVSPYDSHVLSGPGDTMSARSGDLIREGCDPLGPGYVQLFPYKPDLWQGNTVEIGQGKLALKPFDVSVGRKPPKDLFVSEAKMVIGFHSAWPKEADEWVTRKRPALWPDQKLIKMVTEEGCHVIPLKAYIDMGQVTTANKKRPEAQQKGNEDLDWLKQVGGLDSADEESLWAISFEAPVNALSKALSHEQRQGYLLFQVLVHYWLKETYALSLYCLRSTFFRACENIDSSRWKSEPGWCLLYLLDTLQESLIAQKLPCYFLRDHDLLKHIPSDRLALCQQRISILRRQILICLYFCLDYHGLLETEQAALLDEVIEDIFIFARHRNPTRSIMETFIPSSSRLAQEHIYAGEYDQAMKIVMEVLEETTALNLHEEQVPLNFIFQTVVADIPSVGWHWCFALYLDLNLGTALVPETCGGCRTVPIAAVFGPDVVNDLGNLPVPESFSVCQVDYKFVSEVMNVLILMENNKVMASALKFYLNTLNDLYPNFQYPSRYEGEGGYADYSMMKLARVCSLYVQMFNALHAMGREDEFRQMMPQFETLCAFVGTPSAYKNLSSICWYLHEDEKYYEAQEQLNKAAAGSSFGGRRSRGLMSMMGMLGMQ